MVNLTPLVKKNHPAPFKSFFRQRKLTDNFELSFLGFVGRTVMHILSLISNLICGVARAINHDFSRDFLAKNDNWARTEQIKKSP